MYLITVVNRLLLRRSITVAKVGLTDSWGWGILLYHCCFIITIIFIDIAAAAAAAATING